MGDMDWWPFKTLLRRIQAILAVFLVAVSAYFVGLYISSHSISYREIIVTFVGVIGIVAIVAGERGVHRGFLLWICTFGLGYRCVELTSFLKIHPSEVLLWTLMLVLLVQRIWMGSNNKPFWLPRWLILFIPFWLWAWVLGSNSGRPWDLMLSELKNFLLLIPLFVVASSVLSDRTQWRPVILYFYAVGTWIAGLGILEYLLPGIQDIFPGYITDPRPYLTREGFNRASFSFWGNPAATFVCALSVPMVAVVWQWCRLSWQRLLILLALAVQIIGIYVGGYRSMWLLVCIIAALCAFLRFGTILGALALLPAIVLYRFLPETAQQRWITLLPAMEGTPVDHSMMLRQERTVAGLDAIIRNPWGHGWSVAGWVHNDFVQIAVNLGIIGGLVFLGAYLLTLWRSWRLVRQYGRYEQRDLSQTVSITLFLSFSSTGVILATNCPVMLPHLVLPVWFVWVLTGIWLRQVVTERSVE
jgi:O-antigen ligase